MRKIEAIIRSSTIHDVQNALAAISIPTFSSYQIQISGIHKEHKGWRNKTSDFIPKTKIEILCVDKDEANIINTIQKAASTGDKGDGVISSYEIGTLVKIRNNETGESAL